MNSIEPLLQREIYIEELRAENARLRAALEAVEWVGAFISCPWCMRIEAGGHRDDCQRQVALRHAAEQPAAAPPERRGVTVEFVEVNE